MDRLPLVSPESRGNTRAQKWPYPNSSPTRDESRPRGGAGLPWTALDPGEEPGGVGHT